MPRLLENNFLEHHTLSKKRVTRIYIGNQFCHNLFPRKELLFQVLEKALENNLAVTLAFSYIRNHLLEEIDELLQELEVWCQSREKEAGKDQEEIIVNDWAMPILLQGKPHLKPVLGVLLNKRRKDVRLPYKHGIGNHVDSLAENNLNCGFYQDYLKIHSIYKDLNLNHVDIRLQSQMDTTACIFLFFQTNTSQYCTLYAVCRYGDRGKQSCRKTAQDIVTKSISISEAFENGGKI